MKGLGHHFGGSGAPFWSHFGGLGGFWLPNASWKAFWAALGRFSKPRWLQLGAQEGPKLEPKRCKNWWENRSKIRWLWKSIFEGILVDFGKENGGKLAPKSIKNRCRLRKAIFWKIVLSLQRGLDFLGSGGPSWEPRSIKNRSKNEVKMGRQLGIEFSSIFMDFGTQVGMQNRSKIDQKWHRKNDEKKKGNKMGKKSQ